MSVKHYKIKSLTDPILVYRSDVSEKARRKRFRDRIHYQAFKKKILANRKKWRDSFTPEDSRWEKLRIEFRKHRRGQLSGNVLQRALRPMSELANRKKKQLEQQLAEIENASPEQRGQLHAKLQARKRRIAEHLHNYKQRKKQALSNKLTTRLMTKYGKVHTTLPRDGDYARQMANIIDKNVNY